MRTADRAIRPLAQEHVEICRSPDPQRIGCYTPALCRLPGGRLLTTTDWGGDGDVISELGGACCMKRQREGRRWQGRIYTSDDEGASWQLRATFPFMHARPFLAGDTCHIIGQADDLQIIRCDDGRGERWSEPAALTEGQDWHQGASNVHHANGCVYLIMERRVTTDIRGWNVGEKAPVCMRARIGSDLLERDSWTFASELSFRDIIPGIETTRPAIDFFGLPYWPSSYPSHPSTAPKPHDQPMGWLESHLVQFTDPDHQWHDPSGRTLHIFARAHTGVTNYACLAKVVEEGEEPGTGPMRTELQHTPAGTTMLYLPFPGGHMKFHVCRDEPAGLWWLVSSQSTDSMCRPDRMPADRYNLPYNQRSRLALHFSRNMVDWCFAGMVAIGEHERASRHYAHMLIDGDDLLITSRSGDDEAKNAHDVNMITFHRIQDFRDLVY